MNKIGKILLYGFLAFAGISILGLFIVLIVSHFYNPDVNNQTTLTGFFDPLWHKIEDGC
jgi:tetrahydromethanopterin S-methyltransferase subunit D